MDAGLVRIAVCRSRGPSHPAETTHAVRYLDVDEEEGMTNTNRYEVFAGRRGKVPGPRVHFGAKQLYVTRAAMELMGNPTELSFYYDSKTGRIAVSVGGDHAYTVTQFRYGNGSGMVHARGFMQAHGIESNQDFLLKRNGKLFEFEKVK